jgi:hypothetical protein
MQYTRLDKVKLSTSMSRIDATWQGRAVSCAHFPATKSNWINSAATMIAGQAIRGNAVIIGPKTWASLARQLPKTVELDDRARARRAAEQAERSELWREYYQRKANRKRFLNRDTANIDLVTGEVVGEMSAAEQQAHDEADAAFAEWNVEDAMIEQLNEEIQIRGD